MMNSELTLRIIFLALCILLVFIRAYYARRVHQSEKPSIRESWEEQAKREGKSIMVLRSIGFLFFITLLALHATYPQWMTRFRVPFPIWLRWLGVGLGIMSLPLLTWVQQNLGRHWSTGLELREEHTLVTTGPYRWVRHPMYTALFAFLIALALVSANWLMVLLGIGAIILMYARIGKEERMMIEQFGDAYRAYIERTGLLLPRLFR